MDKQSSRYSFDVWHRKSIEEVIEMEAVTPLEHDLDGNMNHEW